MRLKITCIMAPGRRITDYAPGGSRTKVTPGLSWIVFDKHADPDAKAPLYYGETCQSCHDEIARREGRHAAH